MAISKAYKCNFDKIICSAGSDEVIQMLCQLYLNPKDEVIVPQYSFLMYRIYAKIVGAKVVFAKENKFKAINGIINIVPGVSFKIKELPTYGCSDSETEEFNYEQPIYILHYVGEGFHKVYHAGEYTYIAFPDDEVTFAKFSENYDWLRVDKYPTNFEWWAKIEFENIV